MGVMIDGVWHAREPKSDGKDGAFKRPETSFRNWITADGSAGATGTDGFQAEPGRYHLYICHACPWAHRAMIFRALKGLEDVISVSVVHWIMAENGWNFADGEGVVPDPVIGADYLYQVYQHADSNFSGRITVQVLWDLQRNTIVSNESSEIIRMFDSAFVDVAESSPLLCPDNLRAEIDAMNTFVLENINNGVNKCGRSTSQNAYDEAFENLFDALDALEERLGRQRYLIGNSPTEADWRLYPNLIRFDPIYFVGYRCNLRRIVDYPNLSNYLRDLYQTPGIAEVSDIDGMKAGTFGKAGPIGWDGIIPRGPENLLMQAHDRSRFPVAA